MNRSKKSLHGLECELASALKKMLDADESITLRRVIEKCPSINSATTITRDHESLRELYNSVKQEQTLFREKVERASKASKKMLSGELTKKDLKNTDLEEKLQIVISAFVAVVKTSGEFGGALAWIKLFDDYKSTLKIIEELGAIESAKIIEADFLKIGSSKTKK
jgi:hypothetical protein